MAIVGLSSSVPARVDIIIIQADLVAVFKLHLMIFFMNAKGGVLVVLPGGLL